MPSNLYTSKTLVSLKLSYPRLVDTDFVYMSCLKFMDLKNVLWCHMMGVEKHLLGCPVLKEFTLTLPRDRVCYIWLVTRIKSDSLKIFRLLSSGKVVMYKYRFEIDAPKLEYMRIKQFESDTYVVKNLDALFKVDLDLKFPLPENLSKRDEIHDFLIGISSVRHMIISQCTLKVFELYSKQGPIPNFHNLSCLEVTFPTKLLQFLPTLLESFPNLKHLILDFVSSEVMKELDHAMVPSCLLSTLECVEINGFLVWEEKERNVVSYFLQNSSVLKKLILTLKGCPLTLKGYSNIVKELSKLTKASQRCQIILRSD